MKTVTPVYLIVNTLLIIFLLFGCQDSFDLEIAKVSIPEKIANQDRVKSEDGNPFLELFSVGLQHNISKDARIEFLECKLRISPPVENPNSSVCVQLPTIPSKQFKQALSYEAGLLPSELPRGASKVATIKDKSGTITSQVSIRNTGERLNIQATFGPVKKTNIQLFREGKLLKSIPTYKGEGVFIDAFPNGTKEVYHFGERDHPFFVNLLADGTEKFSGAVGDVSFSNVDQIKLIPNFDRVIEGDYIYSFAQCSEGGFGGMDLY